MPEILFLGELFLFKKTDWTLLPPVWTVSAEREQVVAEALREKKKAERRPLSSSPFISQQLQSHMWTVLTSRATAAPLNLLHDDDLTVNRVGSLVCD